MWVAAAAAVLPMLAWAPAAPAGEIGQRVVGGMKIEAELEAGQAMQMQMGGEWMTERPKPSERHFEVALVDPKYGGRIPYATVTAKFTNLTTKASFTKRLIAMYGDQLHYGSNVVLPKGRYSVALTVGAPTLMREGESLDRWLKPVHAQFTFTVA